MSEYRSSSSKNSSKSEEHVIEHSVHGGRALEHKSNKINERAGEREPIASHDSKLPSERANDK